MALLWCDGFEGYGAGDGTAPSPTGVLADKYGVPVVGEAEMDVLTANARHGTAIRLGSTHAWSSSFGTDHIASGSTIVCGTALRFDQQTDWDDDGYWPLFVFWNAGNNRNASVTLSESGVYLLDAANTIQGGTRCQMLYGEWNYIEAKLYSHATAGTLEVRINGCPVLSLTSQNTLNASGGATTAIAYGTGQLLGRKASSTLDDFYICDGTGAVNNDFLGPVTVRTLFPDGDDTTQFAVTGNANYSTHFEQLNDDNESYPTTDYVEDGTTGNRDIYTFDNSTDNFATIYGVVGWGYAQYTSSAINYHLVASSNGTENESSNIAASSDWHYDRYVLETDPDTSNAWTDSTVNALKFGFEVQ